VQNVFTDRRAYVNALNYQMETDTSASGKASKRKEIDDYKQKPASVEFPDGHKEQYNYAQLEEKYNALKDERTKLNAELGEVLKPVTAASTAMSAYINEHMVDLTPGQLEGLMKKTKEWDPKIVQINVAEANIVDRCESCHMGIREPLKLTAASMSAKGAKKPDEYANAFVSHPEPERTSLAVPHATRATGVPPPARKKRTATTNTGCGRCTPKKMPRPAARPAIPPTWSWSAVT